MNGWNRTAASRWDPLTATLATVTRLGGGDWQWVVHHQKDDGDWEPWGSGETKTEAGGRSAALKRIRKGTP